MVFTLAFYERQPASPLPANADAWRGRDALGRSPPGRCRLSREGRRPGALLPRRGHPGAGARPTAEARAAAAASPAKADALARCCHGEPAQARAQGPRPAAAASPAKADAAAAAAAPPTAGAEPTPPAAHPIVRGLDRNGRSGALNWFLGGPIKIHSCCTGFLSE